MANYLIRVEGEISRDLLSAFPQLRTDVELVQTVLCGSVTDPAELTGILNHLNEIGVEIVNVVRIPTEPAPEGPGSKAVRRSAGR